LQELNVQIKPKISSVIEWPIIIHHLPFTRTPAPDELPEITDILNRRADR
jgi:hypothetical protein